MSRIRHHGSIRKRKGGYQVRLCVAGKYHSYTVSGTFNEAASFANTKHAELTRRASRRRAGLPTESSFSGLVEQYRDEIKGLSAGTQRSYNDSLKAIEAYFVVKLEDPPVAKIGRGDVKGYLAWRRTHKLDGKGGVTGGSVTNRTRQKDRTVLHTLFEYAIELELREDNPVRRVKRPESPDRPPVILSDAQYERHLAECRNARQPMLWLYALTLAEAGMRSESEALWLRWSDVDVDAGFLWVSSEAGRHETKGRRGRWVPMTPRLQEAMRAHFAAYRFARYGRKRPEFVFHHTTSKRKHNAGERIRSMRRSFKAAAKRAGLPAKLGQHDYRHRRVTTWLAEGKPLSLVQEAVGHTDARTTQRYTHLSREHLKALVVPVQAPNMAQNMAQRGGSRG